MYNASFSPTRNAESSGNGSTSQTSSEARPCVSSLLSSLLTSMFYRSENKIDQIALRIEELNRTISQLSLAQPQPDKTSSGSINQTTQHASHMNSSPGLVNNTPSSGVTSSYEEKQTPPTQPEFEGESSLSAHATFATKFLQSCVSNSPSSKVMLEMTSVLDTLKAIVDSQKQKADTLETLYPNARPLPAGASLRQLPPLSIEHALAALRMVQGKKKPRNLVRVLSMLTVSQKTPASGPCG